MSITKDAVIHALSHVDDPDLKKDLVSLNMIQDIKITDNKVRFSLVLTTPACPLKNKIRQDCIDAIHQHLGKEVEVEVDVTSSVTTARKAMEETLSGVKNIIAVISGKGGVGKSTVAANIAIALSQTGARVGLIDADIYGPSIPILFGLEDRRPVVTESGEKTHIFPIEKYGIKLLSMGFFVTREQALGWRGPMASNALKQLFSDAEWEELDYLVVDMPPGTGDIQITLAQSMPVTGSLLVTTPQHLAIADVRRAAALFRQDGVKVPLLGVVENMSYFTPDELPEQKYYLFGQGGGKKIAAELNLPLLGEIPVCQGITSSGDAGKPVALDVDSPVAKIFRDIAGKLAQQVSLKNIVTQQS
ncbi:MAG: Mrp/NBP35 family ATP-binding protein [Bacteroidetes bacterium]|nr:Mrp/NBP35 family ATP-binding protein [Bacteroidota bacterium]